MKRLLSLLLLTALPAWAAQLADFNGVWLLESAQLNGDTVDPDQVPMIDLQISNGTYVFNGKDGETKGTFTIDASKTPITMDVHETEGPNAGKDLLTIAELTPKGWRACYSINGGERPKEFKTAADSGQFLAQYKLKPSEEKRADKPQPAADKPAEKK